jgi:hypothetical protein
MGRIRSIKPEFPQSETIGRVSRDARLLFVQLWTIADDAGRMRGASRMLAGLLFPYDDDAPALIDGWLAELEGIGAIRRYSCDGSSYLDIPKWSKHQKIDRPSESRLPAFVAAPRKEGQRVEDNSTKPREASRGREEHSRSVDADLGPRTWDQEDSSLRSQSAREIEILADEFYGAYAKKVDPANATNAFRKAVKRGVDPHRIIAAAKRWAEAWRLAGTDKQYIPAPAVWLNRGGYDSEDLPRPRAGPFPNSSRSKNGGDYLAALASQLTDESSPYVDHTLDDHQFTGLTIDGVAKAIS